MPRPILELRQIRKSFGTVPVIHGVDLTVEEGEFVVFVGPSGCGKSTLLRLIAGLDDVTSGEIAIDERRVNDVPASERGLSMVFQSYALYPHMSVRKNLSFGLENMRIPRAEIARRVEAAAKMLRVDMLFDRRPGQLSGGQRQRVAIGRSIVRQPTIFLFDEPLSNLDAELRLQMRVELSTLHDQLGNTMIYVTHDQVEAMTMADRIVVLQGGRIEQVGLPLDIYNRPVNRFVAGFIGSPQMNFLAGRREGATLVLDGGAQLSLPGHAGGRDAVLVGVRPESVRIASDGEAAHLTGEVAHFEQLGAITYVYARLPSGETVTVQDTHQLPMQRGRPIGLNLATDLLHIFAAGGDGRLLTRTGAEDRA